MNFRIWITRSLRFHRRMHLAVAGGAALAAAVLATALLTGDALNRNLRRIARERVGWVRSAVELRGRFADAALADRLAQATGGRVAPVLRLPASLLASDAAADERRVDRVDAYGVDERFFALRSDSGRAGPPDPPGVAARVSRADGGWHSRRYSFRGVSVGPVLPLASEVLISHALQDALGPIPATTGLALRFEQPSAFPGEMPLADRRSDHVQRRSVRLCGMLDDAEMGRLSLQASQIPPRNAFVDRAWLASEAGVGQRINLLLSDAPPEKFEAALRAALRPSDAGVTIVAATGGVWLVQSDRVYLDEAHVRALANATNAPVLALHHLVDAFAVGEGATARETPYGFVTALSPAADARLGVVPAGMRDDEIVVNVWLAEKLKVGAGDRLTLRWRRFESGGRLVPDEATFRVARVITMAACAPERALLPRVPGLADVDRCTDWDIGLPLDAQKLNDPDNEAYWKAYGPTPKAFVTLTAGRLLFGTHFGTAMTARFPPEALPATIEATLRRAAPAELGFAVRPVQAEALQAAGQAMDFRQLFAGMAMMLMVSALLLTGLLASLGVAHRRAEVGVLRAVGFTPRQVAFLWLAESLVPLTAGVVAGVAIGLGGARLLIWVLNRVWSAAVASAQVPFSIGLEACAAAGALALGMSLLAVRWGIAQASQAQVRELLGDLPDEEAGADRRWTVRNFAIGIGAAIGAIALLAWGGRLSGEAASGVFFGAGALLLVSLLSLARLLAQFPLANSQAAIGPARAGLLNVARHRGRSLLVMTLLASGSFLTIGTLSMKQDPAAGGTRSWSGSGGFEDLVELSIPLPGSRADEAVRRTLEPGAAVLAFRVREGEEAGCLNLNRAQQPRLLGVAPEAAAALRAFERPGGKSVWRLLQQPMADGTIPVLAGDRTTVDYGLQAKVGVRDGSVYEYVGEDGTVWRLRVVGVLPVRTGVLQGSLLVEEAVFTRLFPSTPGHGMWLTRSRLPEAESAARLRRALGRNGGIVTPTRERLRLLGAEEGTYLDMFLVLGGLGVVLGAAGAGLVMLRNAAARRGELATLRVMGVPPRRVLLYLVAEHAWVVLAGLVAGVIAALVAVQPARHSLGGEMPVGTMAGMIAAMILAGILGICAAVRSAARVPLIDALRGE